MDGLPKGWIRTTLGEMSVIVLGQSPPSSTYNDSGEGLPFYQGKKEFGAVYPTPVKWCSSPNKIAEQGDVLISVRAPVGPTNICPEKSCIGRGLAAIRGIAGIGTLFVFYLLRSHENYISGKGQGTTFKAVTGPWLKEYSISLPPLSEQQRIITKIEELFTKLDAGVEALQKLKGQLKRYRQSVLKAAFEGKLTKEWREAHKGKLEPASVLIERIKKERRKKWEEAEWAKIVERARKKAKKAGKNPEKDYKSYLPKDDKWKSKYKEPASPDTSELPSLPVGWVWATLPQLGELNRGKSKHRPRNDPKLYGGPYPFIQTGDVRHANGLLRTYNQTYSEEGLRQSRLWPSGTLCITIAANIADTAILDFDACFPDSVVGFLSEATHCNTRFIELYLRNVQRSVADKAPATAQKNINLDILSKLPIPFPPLAEQEVIADEAERLLSLADAVEKTAKQSSIQGERLRQSILKKAFGGKLVAQDPEDEAADKLLARIRAEKTKLEESKKKKRGKNKRKSKN